MLRKHVLVVWKLDRLSRSLKDMLHILEKLTEVGAGFRSLTENVDSTVPAGKMLLSMLGAFAEFERSMVRERTRMGLQSARERGRIGGRKPSNVDRRVTAVNRAARWPRPSQGAFRGFVELPLLSQIVLRMDSSSDDWLSLPRTTKDRPVRRCSLRIGSRFPNHLLGHT